MTMEPAMPNKGVPSISRLQLDKLFENNLLVQASQFPFCFECCENLCPLKSFSYFSFACQLHNVFGFGRQYGNLSLYMGWKQCFLGYWIWQLHNVIGYVRQYSNPSLYTRWKQFFLDQLLWAGLVGKLCYSSWNGCYITIYNVTCLFINVSPHHVNPLTLIHGIKFRCFIFPSTFNLLHSSEQDPSQSVYLCLPFTICEPKESEH